MLSPVTETVMVTAIVAAALVVTIVSYLVVLMRMGKPLNINFTGYGVDLRVGHVQLSESGAPHGEENDDDKQA